MKKLVAVMLVCMMLIPTVCFADTSLRESGKTTADGAKQALSILITLYDIGTEFNEDNANKLYEFSLMFLMGNIIYYSESEYASEATKKDLISGYSGIMEYFCEMYQEYAKGNTSLKDYVDKAVRLIRTFVETDTDK